MKTKETKVSTNNPFNEELKNKLFKCEYLDVWHKDSKPTVLMQLETTEEEQIQIEFDKHQLIDELSHIVYMKRQLYMNDFLTWVDSDNVIRLKEKYTCQCIQYKKQFTLNELYIYYLNEYTDI
jgi:hypothetical protein